MTKNQLKVIAKFIDAANSSWSGPRIFYRLEDLQTPIPSIIVCSDFSEILFLVSTIENLFCGNCVRFVSDECYKFAFEIF